MYVEYENEINQGDLLYQPVERTSDIQFPQAVNMLLLGIWIVICMVGFGVMFVTKRPVLGAVIIGVPTFLGMVIKPTFALCMLMLVLPTGAGVGIEGVFTLNRGVGIALAVSFVLNLLISRPRLYIRNKAIWVVALYTIWVFLASLTSPYPASELRRAFTYVQLLALVFIVYWILETNSEKSFIWVLRSYVVGSLGTIALTFMTGAAMATMADIAEQQRYAATLGQMIDANMLATLISMAFLASIYLFACDKNIFWRVLYLIGIGFLPLMLLRTGSRGGLIALAFTLMSPLLFIKQISRRPALLVLMLVVIILASCSTVFLVRREGLTAGVVQRITDIEFARAAFAYRMGLIKAATRAGLTRFAGTGFVAWLNINRHIPHNDFFYALGLYGVPAAALFTLFVIMMMLTVRRIPLGIEKLYARAVLTFLLISGLNIVQLAQKHFWVFLTIIIAMERISWPNGGVTEYIDGQTDDETVDINY